MFNTIGEEDVETFTLRLVGWYVHLISFWELNLIFASFVSFSQLVLLSHGTLKIHKIIKV